MVIATIQLWSPSNNTNNSPFHTFYVLPSYQRGYILVPYNIYTSVIDAKIVKEVNILCDDRFYEVRICVRDNLADNIIL